MLAADLDQPSVSRIEDEPRVGAFATLGIVVIGRNEGERLRAGLNALSIEASQIVYVDSGSTDESMSFARQHGVHVVALDPNHKFTAARARNEGANRLLALRPNLRFLQFIDGDCVLRDGWLDIALDFMKRHEDVAVVCGRRRERYPDASIYNGFCDTEWGHLDRT